MQNNAKITGKENDKLDNLNSIQRISMYKDSSTLLKNLYFHEVQNVFSNWGSPAAAYQVLCVYKRTSGRMKTGEVFSGAHVGLCMDVIVSNNGITYGGSANESSRLLDGVKVMKTGGEHAEECTFAGFMDALAKLG